MDDINIKQLIAHDLDLDKETPTLFDKIINLTTVQHVVFDFFKRHITTSLNAKQIKSCKFNDEDAYVYTKSKNIYRNLEDVSVFVDESKRLAKDLFVKMKSSTRSSGALFFLIYSIGDQDYLAIMKMDPNRGIQIDKENQKLIVHKDMLPNPEDKLHKCSFIKLNTTEDEEVHLYVLDRQQTAGAVSRFFMYDFLQATEILNDRIMTEKVLSKLYDESISIAAEQDPLEFEYKVNQIFQSNTFIDLDNTLEGLLRDYMDNEKEVFDYIEGFKSSLREENDEVSFQFTVQRDPTTVTYVSSDKSIKIQFPLDLKENKVEVNHENNQWSFTIKDIELSEKLR